MTDECIINEKRNKAKDKFKAKKAHPYRKNYKKGNKIIEKVKETAQTSFIVISGVFCFFSLMAIIVMISTLVGDKVITIDGEYYIKCNDTSLIKASQCLNAELKIFYNFNVTNVGKLMTEKELVTLGGVCEHYSNWYANNLKAMGFKVDEKLLVQDRSKRVLHKFAIAYGKEGYCILDQLSINCFQYKLD